MFELVMRYAIGFLCGSIATTIIIYIHEKIRDRKVADFYPSLSNIYIEYKNGERTTIKGVISGDVNGDWLVVETMTDTFAYRLDDVYRIRNEEVVDED